MHLSHIKVHNNQSVLYLLVCGGCVYNGQHLFDRCHLSIYE